MKASSTSISQPQRKTGHTKAHVRARRLLVALGREIDPEFYKVLLDSMMKESGVKLLYHTFAAGAIREGDSLKGVLIESKEGRRAIMGKVVIDTTGEGDIAWKSGAPVMGGEGMPVAA